MRTAMGAGLLMTMILLVAGCVGERASEARIPDTESLGQGPDGIFFGLENRMVQARDLTLEFHVTAQGAIDVDLTGVLRIEGGSSVFLDAQGIFAGATVDLLLQTEGDEYRFGNGPNRRTGPTPELLQEALAVGFTRMGILHNLAMLVSDSPPDGTEGGVRDWVQVDSLVLKEPAVGPAGSKAVSFSIQVAGEPVGTAVLELAPGGLPFERRQTVLFPSGEMRVVERYRSASILP